MDGSFKIFKKKTKDNSIADSTAEDTIDENDVSHRTSVGRQSLDLTIADQLPFSIARFFYVIYFLINFILSLADSMSGMLNYDS